MPPKSKIIKLGLESRARELYNNEFSLSVIANTLSNESGQKISKTAVHEYLKSDGRLKSELIEKKTELAVKATEIEINSIDDRLDDIKFLSTLASAAWGDGDYRSAVMAMKVKNDVRDSIDKRLGRITNNPNIQINNINSMKLSEIPTEELLRMIRVTS